MIIRRRMRMSHCYRYHVIIVPLAGLCPVPLVVLTVVAVMFNVVVETAISLLLTLLLIIGLLLVYGAVPLVILLMLSLLVLIAAAVSFTISLTETSLEIASLRLIPLPPTSKTLIYVAYTRIWI